MFGNDSIRHARYANGVSMLHLRRACVPPMDMRDLNHPLQMHYGINHSIVAIESLPNMMKN